MGVLFEIYLSKNSHYSAYFCILLNKLCRITLYPVPVSISNRLIDFGLNLTIPIQVFTTNFLPTMKSSTVYGIKIPLPILLPAFVRRSRSGKRCRKQFILIGTMLKSETTKMGNLIFHSPKQLQVAMHTFLHSNSISLFPMKKIRPLHLL